MLLRKKTLKLNYYTEVKQIYETNP